MGKRRTVGFQKTKVVKGTTSSSGGEDRDDNGERTESPLSNPDLLEYKQSNLLWPSKQTELSELEENVLQELTGFNFGKLLTRQEIKVIKLYVSDRRTVPDIVEETGLSKRRVYGLLKSCGEKIRQHLKMKEG